MKVRSFKLKDENEFKQQRMKLVSSNFKIERIFLKIHEWGSQKSHTAIRNSFRRETRIARKGHFGPPESPRSGTRSAELQFQITRV